jgi:hypothetical protein
MILFDRAVAVSVDSIVVVVVVVEYQNCRNVIRSIMYKQKLYLNVYLNLNIIFVSRYVTKDYLFSIRDTNF